MSETSHDEPLPQHADPSALEASKHSIEEAKEARAEVAGDGTNAFGDRAPVVGAGQDETGADGTFDIEPSHDEDRPDA